jgi:uncharacterized membrane protein
MAAAAALALATAAVVATSDSAAAVPAHRAAPRIEVVDLGSLGAGSDSVAQAMNERGQVVGYSHDTLEGDGDGWRAFVWERGRMRELPTPPEGGPTYAKAISETGVVAGQTFMPSTGQWRAVVWRRGRVSMLPVPSGAAESAPSAVNSRGQVVGRLSRSGTGVRRESAVLWANDSMRLLDPPVPLSAEATALDIDERGRVLVEARVGGTLEYWFWADGRFTRLNGFLRTFYPPVMNARGQIAGEVRDEAGRTRVRTWTDGRWRDSNAVPAGSEVAVVDLNERGDVIGWIRSQEVDANGEPTGFDHHGFLWRVGAKRYTDLGNAGGLGLKPRSINNRGLMSAYIDSITSAAPPQRMFVIQHERLTELPEIGNGYNELVAINDRGEVSANRVGYAPTTSRATVWRVR